MRFAFVHIWRHRWPVELMCRVLQVSDRVFLVEEDPAGSHDLISHDGPRSEKGGRLSYVAGRISIRALEPDEYGPGESYCMPALEYHDTPNQGIVVTIMEKLHEGSVHASSLITHGVEFDQSFDRFQLSEDELWAVVQDALRSAA